MSSSFPLSQQAWEQERTELQSKLSEKSLQLNSFLDEVTRESRRKTAVEWLTELEREVFTRTGTRQSTSKTYVKTENRPWRTVLLPRDDPAVDDSGMLADETRLKIVEFICGASTRLSSRGASSAAASPGKELAPGEPGGDSGDHHVRAELKDTHDELVKAWHNCSLLDKANKLLDEELEISNSKLEISKKDLDKKTKIATTLEREVTRRTEELADVKKRLADVEGVNVKLEDENFEFSRALREEQGKVVSSARQLAAWKKEMQRISKKLHIGQAEGGRRVVLRGSKFLIPVPQFFCAWTFYWLGNRGGRRCSDGSPHGDDLST